MTLDKLVNKLTQAAQGYYQGNGSTMTDEEYDKNIEILRAMATEEDIASNVQIKKLLEYVAGGTAPVEDAIKHKTPMLSLLKAKSVSELSKYYDRVTAAGANGFIVQSKLDGIAISLIYEAGKLVRCCTRGDGEIGQDISYLIDNKDLKIENMLTSLPANETIEIRGEVFSKLSQFNEYSAERAKATGENFSNYRNATIGVIKKAQQGLGYKATMTFAAYSVIKDKAEDISYCNKLGVLTVNDFTQKEYEAAGGKYNLTVYDFQALMLAVKDFGEVRNDFDIPTDGCVIKPLAETVMLTRLGNTSHHPIAFIAYKYPSVGEITKIVDVIYTVGKTGKLTPNARVTPVSAGGTTITRASLHNFYWMIARNIRIGSIVTVFRANDVIPQVGQVLESPTTGQIVIPKKCPSCGKPLYVGNFMFDGKSLPKTLLCKNEACPSRLEFQLKSIASHQGLDIDGLSNVGISALCNGLIKNVGDLFFITEKALSELVIGTTSTGSPRCFGKANAKKVIEAINKAKTQTPAYRLLYCLGIDRFGPSYAKALIASFKTVENALSATRKQLAELPGWGETRIEAFIDQAPRAMELLKRLREAGFVTTETVVTTSSQSFSISGEVPAGYKNRGEFVDAMQALGWEYHSSPKATTDFLIADPNGSSSKIKTAIKNGTKIVSTLPL